MTKKEQLIEIFNMATEYKNDFIAVAIKTRGSNGIEIIINPKCNFSKKLEYYKKAYNDELILNTFDGISIYSAVSFDNDTEIGYIKEALLEQEF